MVNDTILIELRRYLQANLLVMMIVFVDIADWLQ
jgi:hypothetical protein